MKPVRGPPHRCAHREDGQPVIHEGDNPQQPAGEQRSFLPFADFSSDVGKAIDPPGGLKQRHQAAEKATDQHQPNPQLTAHDPVDHLQPRLGKVDPVEHHRPHQRSRQKGDRRPLGQKHQDNHHRHRQ